MQASIRRAAGIRHDDVEMFAFERWGAPRPAGVPPLESMFSVFALCSRCTYTSMFYVGFVLLLPLNSSIDDGRVDDAESQLFPKLLSSCGFMWERRPLPLRAAISFYSTYFYSKNPSVSMGHQIRTHREEDISETLTVSSSWLFSLSLLPLSLPSRVTMERINQVLIWFPLHIHLGTA